MAVSQTARAALLNYALLAALLLAVFTLSTADIQRESLWFDEAYTLYIVRDEGRLPDGLSSTARYVLDSLRQAVERAREDVHPPLYFVLFDVWTLLAGESPYAARLPSALFGLVGLAATYALGRRLFDRPTALIAVLILGTASLFLYYTREARMYTLLLALAALATLAYLRWVEQPTILRTICCAVLLAALPYTHYAGGLLPLTHLVHLLWTRPARIGHLVLPVGLALALFAPWLPSVIWQWNAHGGPAAPPFGNTITAAAALVFFLTGGYWALYLLPFGLGSALPRARQHSDALSLLLAWLLLTPAALLLFSRWIPAVFQVRYTLAALPAGALLVAYGIRWVGDKLPLLDGRTGIMRLRGRLRPAPTGTPASSVLQNASRLFAVVFLTLLILTQLTVYPFVWPPRSRWDEAARQMVSVRHPLEPVISLIPPHTPAAYYDRRYGIRQGIALDLAWRWQEPDAMRAYVAHLAGADAVWVVAPSTLVSAWDGIRELLADRGVGYRDSVMDTVFYRFDRDTGDTLHFQFGDVLAFDSGIEHHLYARAGEDFCFDVSLTARDAVPAGMMLEMYLTQGYSTLRAQESITFGPYGEGNVVALSPCIPVPADTPAGPHHLRLRIYQPSGQALPLLEHNNLYWGDVLVMALVSVDS